MERDEFKRLVKRRVPEFPPDDDGRIAVMERLWGEWTFQFVARSLLHEMTGREA